MRVVEVFGAPGVGKSTLCNATWSPSVPSDGKAHPADWQPFLDCAERLARAIGHQRRGEHWRQMFEKALRKVATLQRMPGGVYAGVGLVMRGIDLGWRVPEGTDLAEFFRLVPAPAAAISLYADVETIRQRNRERGRTMPSRELSAVAATYEAPRRLAVAILRARGVPVLELDTRNPADDNRSRIAAFVGLPAAVADAGAA